MNSLSRVACGALLATVAAGVWCHSGGEARAGHFYRSGRGPIVYRGSHRYVARRYFPTSVRLSGTFSVGRFCGGFNYVSLGRVGGLGCGYPPPLVCCRPYVRFGCFDCGCFPAYAYRPPVIYSAPLVIPAEQLFGLGPIVRMFGAPRPPAAPLILAPQPQPAGAAPLIFAQPPAAAGEIAAQVQPRQPQAQKEPQPRQSNEAARERARKFREFGDTHFAQQKYRSAYNRYSLAIRSAPDLVEGYLKKGQSLIAMGNYEMAAITFKRALKLSPDWAHSKFRLDDIYNGNGIAKAAHLEALADKATGEPDNADLMLLVAVQLFYDGQADRSEKFFRRAAQLNGQPPPAARPAAQAPPAVPVQRPAAKPRPRPPRDA